jgi:hypothetical protein
VHIIKVQNQGNDHDGEQHDYIKRYADPKGYPVVQKWFPSKILTDQVIRTPAM